MLDTERMAIACGGVGFKAAFTHGVLSAFEAHGLRAAAYAGASLAALPAALAAAGEANAGGAHLWQEGQDRLDLPENDMSDVAIALLAATIPALRKKLFARGAPRLLIAATEVQTVEGAVETQGARAGALGRRLSVHAQRRDRSWATTHLAVRLWDSRSTDRAHALTADNLRDVLYASARSLVGWQIPAEIDGRPYVDAVYTCACPALELAALEYRDVVAISGEEGPIYRDFFRSLAIPESSWRARIAIIRPTIELKSIGVDDTIASDKGLIALFDHGLDRGLSYLADREALASRVDPRFQWPRREA